MVGQVISNGVTVLGMADLKITTGTKVEKAYQLGVQLGSKLLEK
jgi:hypothetical protein